MDTDALLLGVFDLPGAGRHLGPGAAVDDGDRLGSQTQRRPGGVDGDVAAADDGDAPADLLRAAQVRVAQEDDAGHHAGQVLAGFVREDDREVHRLVGVGEAVTVLARRVRTGAFDIKLRPNLLGSTAVYRFRDVTPALVRALDE